MLQKMSTDERKVNSSTLIEKQDTKAIPPPVEGDRAALFEVARVVHGSARGEQSQKNVPFDPVRKRLH